MVTKLDDFLRRRSKIALVVSRQTLLAARDCGLRDACLILFGDRADAKLDEYFAATEPRDEHAS